VEVPVFVAKAPPLGPEVQAAIYALYKSGISPQVIRHITWNVETDAGLQSLWSDNEGNATSVVIKLPEDVKQDYAPIPHAIADVLREWAYPDAASPPTAEDLMVPAHPGGTHPMPLATLRRIVKNAKHGLA